MISQVFYVQSGNFGFQYVGGYYRVYNGKGQFVRDFAQFEDMCNYIAVMDSWIGGKVK